MTIYQEDDATPLQQQIEALVTHGNGYSRETSYPHCFHDTIIGAKAALGAWDIEDCLNDGNEDEARAFGRKLDALIHPTPLQQRIETYATDGRGYDGRRSAVCASLTDVKAALGAWDILDYLKQGKTKKAQALIRMWKKSVSPPEPAAPQQSQIILPKIPVYNETILPPPIDISITDILRRGTTNYNHQRKKEKLYNLFLKNQRYNNYHKKKEKNCAHGWHFSDCPICRNK